MCLVNATKRKAKDDTICYKVLSPAIACDENGSLRTCIKSPYQTWYEWKVGLNEAEGPAAVKRSEVSAGFLHAFANYDDAKSFACFICARVYKAIIPKGSVYYRGNDAGNAWEIHYASKKLILMQQIY